MENNRKTFNARAAMLLLSAATLSGCGTSTPAGYGANAADPVAVDPDTATPSVIEPGRWELATIARADVIRTFGSPPPADPERDPGSRRQSRVRTICITPQLAAAPTPVLILASDGVSGCERRVWRLRDGRIDGELTCNGERANMPPVSVSVSGSYSRESFESEAEVQPGAVVFSEKVQGRRVGACTGDERP